MMNEQSTKQLTALVEELRTEGRYDELLRIIGIPTLQRLNLEAAKAELSPLVITEDYKFLLTAYNKEVELAPVAKAVYLLFLNHEEGINFKYLIDYKAELFSIYERIGSRVSSQTIQETVNRLVDPMDNSINEKCARIKAAFGKCMNQYQLSYYEISRHAVRMVDESNKVWYDRKKIITLPRNLVIRKV